MAVPAGRALRQVLFLRMISVTPARTTSGGKGSPQHRASKTLVSFPVKFSAASQDSVTGEGRSDVLSKLSQSTASIALQELGDQGSAEHFPSMSLGPEDALHPGKEESQEQVKSVGKGPEKDEDSSSSSSSDSSSDSEDEGDMDAKAGVKAAGFAPDFKENGFFSVNPEPKQSHPSVDLLSQDGSTPATVHPEVHPGEGTSGDQTEQLIDQAPDIHTKGEAQGKEPPHNTEASAFTGAQCSEDAKTELSLPEAGLVEHLECQPEDQSMRDNSEQLMDQAPVINIKELAQDEAPETLCAPVEHVPLTEAPGPEGVEMERSGEVMEPSGEASSATQSPVPPTDMCEANPLGTEEEITPKSSASSPPAASVPPAAPVVEVAQFDNSKYQNLQHFSYTPYTFVDCDLELSKVRLPQPSSGRPSPRH